MLFDSTGLVKVRSLVEISPPFLSQRTIFKFELELASLHQVIATRILIKIRHQTGFEMPKEGFAWHKLTIAR